MSLLGNPFIIHTIVEMPLALLAAFAPGQLPLPGMHPVMVFIMRMWGFSILCTCLASILVAPLPAFLPGKRALALSLIVYHMILSSLLWTNEQPLIMLPPEHVKLSASGELVRGLIQKAGWTPERLYAVAHAVVTVSFGVWWQATVELTSQVARGQMAGPAPA